MGFITRARWWIRRIERRRRFLNQYRDGARTAKPGPHALIVVFDHPRPLGDPAAIVRSADAFGARAVYLVGTDYFEPRPAMESLRNVPMRLFKTFSDVYRELVAEGYVLFALEPAQNREGSTFLHATTLPAKTALVVGDDANGISFSPAEFEGVVCLTVSPQGEARRLSPSVAAGVAMYEYVRQHGESGRK